MPAVNSAFADVELGRQLIPRDVAVKHPVGAVVHTIFGIKAWVVVRGLDCLLDRRGHGNRLRVLIGESGRHLKTVRTMGWYV